MSGYVIVITVALAGVVLLIWVWGKNRVGEARNNLAALEKLVEHDPRIARLVQRDESLSEVEIGEALKLIPIGRAGAQTIEARLKREDLEVVRRQALQAFASLDALPSGDYWTLPVLVSLVGRPFPQDVVSQVLQQFRAATTNREMFAGTLVDIGTGDAARVLVEALNSNEKPYLTRMKFPIEAASARGWLNSDFRRILSNYFAERAERDPQTFSKHYAPDMWLQIDPERATDRLTDPPFWQADFERLWEVVRGLKDNAARIREDRIWSLYEAIRTKESMEGLRHRLVWLLARVHSRRVDPLIEELKANPETQEEALRAEAALAGVISPRKVIERHLDKPGYHQSPAAIKHLWAIELLGMELQNGGMHQYFFNSSGDLWPDALEGLEQAGYQDAATAFRKAISVFGKTPPSTNRAERIQQLNYFSKADEKILYKHGDQVYAGFQQTNMWPYIMRHTDIFRQEPARH
jgi:hypothetical protein